MPHSKPVHKKKNSYWYKKWLNAALIKLKLKKRRFQKPPSDIVFLTTKEVKASLEKTAELKPVNFSADSLSRPDQGILPAKNRSRRKSQRNKNIRFRLKLLLNQLSFGIFYQELSPSAHHRQSRRRLPDHDTDAKFRRTKELNRLKEDKILTEPSPNQGHRHHHHRNHNHRSRFRKWKSFIKRQLHLTRKKSGFILPAEIDHTESTTDKQEKKAQWTDYIKPALISTAMFMVAYQLSWFFYQLVVMIAASFFGIDSVLYYYEVMFPVGSNALIWTPEKIIIITLSGPFSAMLVWILLRFILHWKSHYGSQFRMFLVWMYLMSMMMFLGAFVGGAITLEGFGYVIDWLFMSISLRLILSLIVIGIIIALSWNVAGFMPETTRPGSWKNSRYKYILSRLIIPWFLGAGIMTLLKITKNITQHENIFDYDIINLATLVFAIVPPLFNSRSHPQLVRHRKVNQRLKAELPVLWVMGAIILVLLFRFLLIHGIYFRLIFDLDINFYN